MLFPLADWLNSLQSAPLVGRRNMRCVLYPLNRFHPIFIFNPASSSNVILEVSCHPYRFRARYTWLAGKCLYKGIYIFLKYTATFTFSLFLPSGTKKSGVSAVLPFPSSLLDAKLIYDRQSLILIPRITLVRGLLENKGNEWPAQLVPEHTKNVQLWESKALMKSSKLPRELACSWGTVYPAAISLPIAINPPTRIKEEDRVQAMMRVKTGPVV
jgi:hypothetical protein